MVHTSDLAYFSGLNVPYPTTVLGREGGSREPLRMFSLGSSSGCL